MTIGVAGVLIVVPFPQDSLGGPGTTAGANHIGLAGAVSILTVATTILLGFALRRDPVWAGVSSFSYVMGLVILVTGAIAGGVSAGARSPLLGLFEQMTIWSLRSGRGGAHRVVLRGHGFPLSVTSLTPWLPPDFANAEAHGETLPVSVANPVLANLALALVMMVDALWSLGHEDL